MGRWWQKVRAWMRRSRGVALLQDKLPDGRPVPEGLDFLALIWDQEDRGEAETDRLLPTLGVQAPKTLEAIGTMLSLLDRAATCYWGCAGGDHVVEYLIGRAESSARAGLRLARMGFYDEALGSARNIGEIANLLVLFSFDDEALDKWPAASSWDRWNQFRPKKVRDQLKSLKAPMIEEDRYGLLSNMATHPSPDPPQVHNAFGRPMVGGRFQTAGLLLVLNEIGIALGFVALGAGTIVPIDKSRRVAILEAGRALFESLGRLEVTTVDELWGEVRAKPEHAAAERALRRSIARTRRRAVRPS